MPTTLILFFANQLLVTMQSFHRGPLIISARPLTNLSPACFAPGIKLPRGRGNPIAEARVMMAWIPLHRYYPTLYLLLIHQNVVSWCCKNGGNGAAKTSYRAYRGGTNFLLSIFLINFLLTFVWRLKFPKTAAQAICIAFIYQCLLL